MAEAYLAGESPAEVSCTSDMTGKKSKQRKQLFQINTHPTTVPDLAANNKRDKRLKQIVMRVVAFCKKEHEEGLQVPLHFFKKRASLMTGVSLSTIHRIETIDMKCQSSDVTEQMEDNSKHVNKSKHVKVKKTDDNLLRKKQMKKEKETKGKTSVNQDSCSVSCDRLPGQATIQCQVAVTSAYPLQSKPGAAVDMPTPERATPAGLAVARQGKGKVEDMALATNTHSSLSLLASAAVSLGPVNLLNSQNSSSTSVHSSLGSSSNSSMEVACQGPAGVGVSGLHLAPSAAMQTLQPLAVQPAPTWHILSNLPNLPTQLCHQPLGNTSSSGGNHGALLVSGAGTCMGQVRGELAGQQGRGSVRTVQVLGANGSVRTVQVVGANGVLAAMDTQQGGAQQQPHQPQWASTTSGLPSLSSITVGGQPFLQQQQQKPQQAPPCLPLQVLDAGGQPLMVNGSSLMQQQQLQLPLYQQLQQLLCGNATSTSGPASQMSSVPRLPGQTPQLTALPQTVPAQPGLTMPLSGAVSWGTWQPATLSYVSTDTTSGQPSSSLLEEWGQVTASTSLGQQEFQPCNPAAARAVDSLEMQCGDGGEDGGSVCLAAVADLDRVDVTCGPGVTVTALEEVSLSSSTADVAALEGLNVTGSMESVSLSRENSTISTTPAPHLYQQLQRLQSHQQLPSHFYQFS